jgi:hypothetical protein
MAATSYGDAMGAALERLQGVGYEFGPAFVNHAPMAAEALARLGYTDEVPGWVDRNVRRRRYYDPPQPVRALSGDDPQDWRSALGDFGRVADWSALFARELAGQPWADVLARWWPRLLPGMSGMLTHGVIRTAHAVRALALTGGDGALQRGELAQGLGYWAARYSGGPNRARPAAGPVDEDTDARLEARRQDVAQRSAQALRALDGLVTENAGVYLRTPQSFPVPLIHAITGPAAVRLACDHLPPELHQPSYEAAARCSAGIRSWLGADANADGGAPEPAADNGPDPDPDGAREAVAAAVALGDEHAVKLAEVAVRHYSRTPDDRLLEASRAATRQIARNPV